jgi:hypothetical protein
VTAKIEFFFDTPGQKLLMSRTYIRYKMIVPDPRPWGMDETILTASPQILDEDHFFQKYCHVIFWESTYASSTTNDEAAEDSTSSSVCGSRQTQFTRTASSIRSIHALVHHSSVCYSRTEHFTIGSRISLNGDNYKNSADGRLKMSFSWCTSFKRRASCTSLHHTKRLFLIHWREP